MFKTQRKGLLAAIYTLLLWIVINTVTAWLFESYMLANPRWNLPIYPEDLVDLISLLRYVPFFIGAFFIVNRLLIANRTDHAGHQEKQKRVEPYGSTNFNTRRKGLLAAIYILLLWIVTNTVTGWLLRSFIDSIYLAGNWDLPIYVGDLMDIVNVLQHIPLFFGAYFIINRLLIADRAEAREEEKRKRVDVPLSNPNRDTDYYDSLADDETRRLSDR